MAKPVDLAAEATRRYNHRAVVGSYSGYDIVETTSMTPAEFREFIAEQLKGPVLRALDPEKAELIEAFEELGLFDEDPTE